MSLVLFAGQSNALGYLNDGPAPYIPTWRVQIWTDVNHNGQWDVGDNFNMMVPGLNTGTAARPGDWGPEVAFANDWLAAHPDGSEILWIGKAVKGSSPLSADPGGLDWSPATGELFTTLGRQVALSMQANLGVAKLDAVFWMQGEQDATRADWAAAYEGNLTSFLAHVRADWMRDPTGYVELGRITDSPALPYNLDVRWAQLHVDEADPYTESFRTIEFERQPDLLHYDQVGQLALGDHFYAGWIA